MASKEREIEIATDFKHQRRLWVVERVGWAAIGLLAVAALLGLMGSGPLSKATAGTRDSALWVDYQRFDRYEASSTLRVHVGAATIQGQSVRLWLSQDYLGRMAIEGITPEPEAQEVATDRVVYVFNVAGTNQPVEIKFELRAKEFGRNQVRLGVVGGPDVAFQQFIYP